MTARSLVSLLILASVSPHVVIRRTVSRSGSDLCSDSYSGQSGERGAAPAHSLVRCRVARSSPGAAASPQSVTNGLPEGEVVSCAALWEPGRSLPEGRTCGATVRSPERGLGKERSFSLRLEICDISAESMH